MKPKWWHIGVLLALGVALLSPLASPHPDGLERVAENKGFLENAKEAAFNIVPGYAFPGVENEAVATIAAGLMGTLILFGVGYGLAWLLRSRERERL